MRSFIRFLLPSVFVLSSVGAVVACSSNGSDDANASSSDIVGGTPTSDPRVVFVADENDLYACSGAVVAPDIVAVAGMCGNARVAGVYVGLATTLDRSKPIGPQAGGAQVIEVDAELSLGAAPTCSNVSMGMPRLVRLKSAIPGVTPFTRATASPSSGTTCKIIGHGPDADGGGVGQQRTAFMDVTSGAACEVQAKGLTGSVAVGEWDGVLVCGGALAGLKDVTINMTPTQVDNEIAFVSLGDPDVAARFDAVMAQLAAQRNDAGADAATDAGPPPEPGTACSTVDAIAYKSCGACGTQAAACIADDDGGAPKWSYYSVCYNEVPNGCVPGTVDTTSAGCATPGTTRKRTCNATCTWGTWSLTCS